MSPWFRQLLDSCGTLGARDAALSELQRCAPRPLPRDYVAFLRDSNGFSGEVGPNYLSLWPAEDVARYGFYPETPRYLFFGSNGGGEGLAFDLQNDTLPIVQVPFVGMVSTPPRLLARTIDELLDQLRRHNLFDIPAPPDVG